MYDIVKYFEDDTRNILSPIENVWDKDNDYYTLANKCLVDFLHHHQYPFLSNIVDEEEFELPESLDIKLNVIVNELGFNQETKENIQKLLTKLFLEAPNRLEISKSKEGEFLVYTLLDGCYKNILIDEDGDIEILIIPQNKKDTISKRFYKEDGLNYSKIASTFNEL